LANEATIYSGLAVTTGNLRYRTPSTSFRADVAGAKGPSPGAITAAVAGTDVDFSELTTPALCFLKNLDETNWVEVGPRDPDTGVFHPFLKLLPGESCAVRLSHNLGSEVTGTGSGTGNATFRIRANTAACVVQVDAFQE
jgi:hypothetical protein